MNSDQQSAVKENICFRQPSISDAPAIIKMVKESKVLDVNSDYAYLIFCAHFSKTCVIAEVDGNIAGFATAYIPPDKSETLFVWQIYIKPLYRRIGLGLSLIESLLKRLSSSGVRYLEATINPSNQASEKLFRFIADKYNTDCSTSTFFESALFSSTDHEDEVLFRIGPLAEITH